MEVLGVKHWVCVDTLHCGSNTGALASEIPCVHKSELLPEIATCTHATLNHFMDLIIAFLSGERVFCGAPVLAHACVLYQ